MGAPIKKTTEKYTYGDYLRWPEEERWELINGQAFAMTPAPSRRHQEIAGFLFTQFSLYLNQKTCRVYFAPFDVRLPEGDEADEEIATVVQPDIVIVCDPVKLDDRGCKGSPDLVVEIVSPNTGQKDLKEKFILYEKVKVKEYWIVHPVENTVMVFKLNETGQYGKPEMYGANDQIQVGIFNDLTIDLNLVFQ
jgi:Uma2 family endonuclease